MEELKIFIDNTEEVEKKIVALGAILKEEVYVDDTYFKQPEGEVLKMTQNSAGTLLIKLKAQNGGFAFVSQDSIEDIVHTTTELEKKYGIKCVLKKRIRYFSWEGYQINILKIEGLGNFLIVEGQKVPKEVVEQKLGFANPKYLTMSFDKLKEEMSLIH